MFLGRERRLLEVGGGGSNTVDVLEALRRRAKAIGALQARLDAADAASASALRGSIAQLGAWLEEHEGALAQARGLLRRLLNLQGRLLRGDADAGALQASLGEIEAALHSCCMALDGDLAAMRALLPEEAHLPPLPFAPDASAPLEDQEAQNLLDLAGADEAAAPGAVGAVAAAARATLREAGHLERALAAAREPAVERARVDGLLDLLTRWRRVFARDPAFAGPIFERAHVIAATCLTAGRRGLREVTFDWAIIDEAGRATATELLVSMVRARKVVLVGDERQLPPMIDADLTPDALAEAGLSRAELEQSLFETLIRQAREEGLDEDPTSDETQDVSGARHAVMLTAQHRMLPAIGRMISSVFYDGALRDGAGAARRGDGAAFGIDWLLRPVCWYSTSGLRQPGESRRGASYANATEASVTLALLQRIEERLSASRGLGRLALRGGSADLAHPQSPESIEQIANWGA